MEGDGKGNQGLITAAPPKKSEIGWISLLFLTKFTFLHILFFLSTTEVLVTYFWHRRGVSSLMISVKPVSVKHCVFKLYMPMEKPSQFIGISKDIARTERGYERVLSYPIDSLYIGLFGWLSRITW